MGALVWGEEKPVPLLVITDLRTVDNASSIAEANAFSEFIRKEIEHSGLYRVLSRSSMLAILKARKFPLPCHELPCFASMGKLLGADQVLAGNLQHSEPGLEITLRLIDVQHVRFIRTVYRPAASLTSAALFGAWGRSVIAETFAISESALLPETDADATTESQPTPIPDSVRLRYPGMKFIPAGEVILGCNEGDEWERPPHRVVVDAFYIAQFEVTNQEYAEFVQATGHRSPPHWNGGLISPGLEKHPVTWISYEDAETYCTWKNARLPTEAEWERAAKGDTDRAYTWGKAFDSNLANTWEAGRGGTAPVGSYFRGASPFGVEDMAGNAFEWVNGFFEPYPGAKELTEQYDQHLRVLRGGSWNFNSYYARTTHRFARSGGEQGSSYGFRIARDF